MIVFFSFALIYGLVLFPRFWKLNAIGYNKDSRPFVKFAIRQKLKLYFIAIIGTISFICKGILYASAPPNETSFAKFLLGDFFYRFAPIQIVVVFWIMIETGIILVKYFDLLNAEIPKVFEWGILSYDALLLILLVAIEISASYHPDKYSLLVSVHTSALYYPSLIMVFVSIAYAIKLKLFFKSFGIENALSKKVVIYATATVIYGLILICCFAVIYVDVSDRPIAVDLTVTYVVWIGIITLFTCLSFQFSATNIKRKSENSFTSNSLKHNSVTKLDNSSSNRLENMTVVPN